MKTVIGVILGTILLVIAYENVYRNQKGLLQKMMVIVPCGTFSGFLSYNLAFWYRLGNLTSYDIAAVVMSAIVSIVILYYIHDLEQHPKAVMTTQPKTYSNSISVKGSGWVKGG